MKNNCGVIAYKDLVDKLGLDDYVDSPTPEEAFDKMAGRINGRTTKISMNTMSKMAQDNGFNLHPIELPATEIHKYELPLIVNAQNHFETVEPHSLESGEGYFYILTTELIPGHEEYIMDEDQSSQILGAGWRKRISKAIRRPVRRVTKSVARPVKKVGKEVGRPIKKGGEVGGRLMDTGFASYMIKPFSPEHIGEELKRFERSKFRPETARPGFQTYAPIAAGLIPGIGPLLAAGVGAGAAGFSAYRGGRDPLIGAAGGAATGYGTQVIASNVVPGWSQGFPGATGGAAAKTAATGAAKTAATGGGAGGWMTANVPGAAGAAPAAAGDFGFIKPIAGLAGAAGLFASGQQETPEFPGYQPRTELPRDRTEAGQAAGKAITEGLEGDISVGQFAQLAEDSKERLKIAYGDQRKSVQQRFESAGMLDSGEFNAEMRKLDEREMNDFRQIEQNIVATQQNTIADFRSRLISQGLQLDQATANELMGYTGMDAEQVALKHGADVADVQSIRDMYAQAGQMGLMYAMGAFG